MDRTHAEIARPIEAVEGEGERGDDTRLSAECRAAFATLFLIPRPFAPQVRRPRRTPHAPRVRVALHRRGDAVACGPARGPDPSNGKE